MSEQFDPKKVMEAVEAVNRGFEEFKAANDERLKEVEKKGSADVVLEEKLQRVDEAINKAQETADQAVLAAKRRERIVTDAKGNVIDVEAKAREFGKMASKGRVTDFTDEAFTEYKSVLNDRYARFGPESLTVEERKALSVGSDPNGGYVVYPDMSGRIVKKVFESSPMRAYATIQTISTDALEGIFDLNEASAGWVQETGARTSTNTPEIGQYRIPAHEMYAFPQATQTLLDDAAINMEQWLSDKVADKFARLEATAFVNGTGVGQPRGFLTYADGTTLPGTIEQFDTGVNGGYAAAPNGGDVLISALYGLKAPYRANATWAMNRATTSATRKLKDSDGAYIWSPGIAAGQPASLLGYPVAAFEDMPDPATGSLSVAVGDFREAYTIVERIGMRILRDPYSNKPYVGLYMTKRCGGDVVNFEAIKLVNFQA